MVYTPFVWLQLAAAALQGGLALYARRYRGAPAVRPFIVLMWAAALWALEYAVDMSTPSLPPKIVLAGLRLTFAAFLPAVALWLALEYTGQSGRLTRRRLALLLAIPALTVVLSWIGGSHSLYRHNYRLNPAAPFPLLMWDAGVMNWVYLSYATLVILGAIWVLVRAARAGALPRHNALILIAGLLLPTGADALYNLGITPWRGYNPASATLVVTGILVGWAIIHLQLFGFKPVARGAAIDAIDDLVFVLNADDRLVDLNRAAGAACGLAHPNGAALPPAWDELVRRYRGLPAGKDQVTLDCGAGPRAYDLTISAVQDGRGRALGRLFVLHDITARKQAEATLRESEERHRTMFETAVQGIIYQDTQGLIVSANPAAERILGLSLDQMLGRGSLDPRWKSIHEDGSDFPGETHPAMVALRTGREVRDNVIGVFNPHRDAYVWLNVSAIPQFRAGETTPWQVYTTFEDITARRQAEHDLLRYAAQLAAQNAELDAFAHTVAHDLKNPLGTIIGFADLLVEDIATMSPQNAAQAARNIMRVGQKLDRSIDELMLLAGVRKQEVAPQLVDMSEVVREALERLQLLIEARHAQIELVDEAAWPLTFGYAPWLVQVWDNYISNAIKYGGRPPRVQIGAGLAAPSGPAGRTEVRFWVQDNGPGLSAEALETVFTPFVRLDQVRAQGHGLGLPIVRRIVEKLGGQVGVESLPGQGSRFFFTLPLGD